MKYPNEQQIQMYYAVSQGDADLPCAFFLIEIDAKSWCDKVNEADGTDYKVVWPKYRQSND
jgi:hypothetical protein